MARTALDQLFATAAGLKRASRWRKTRLPPLLFVTDPTRTPDVAAVAERLPRGAGVVLRTFGRAAPRIRRQGLTLLVGADARLAIDLRADGLHLPERMAPDLPRIRARHPRWLITIAGHSPLAVRKARGADAVILSTVFESRSSSAGRAMGPLRLAAIARSSPVPVYALGGVDMKNARRLRATGVIGFAAVDGVVDAVRT